MMRALLMISVLLLAAGTVRAQLVSITAASEYSIATGKRMGVEDASAVGGRTIVRFAAGDDLTYGFTLGYVMFSISQKDQLTAWNWDFWNNRYSNTIRSNIMADPNLSVEIGSVQKIDLVPMAFMMEYRLLRTDEVSAGVSMHAGAAFFTRRLFAEETWSKKFPAANYTFTYSYRNFAPEKKGTVLTVRPGVSATYRLFSSVDLTAGAVYSQYLSADWLTGSREFPMDHDVTLSLGLDFTY